MKKIFRMLLAVCLFVGLGIAEQGPSPGVWTEIETTGVPAARNEAGFVELGGKAYLIGGRGMHAVDEYDPRVSTWRELAAPPMEMHHIQPVVHRGKIWIAGGLTGDFPDEKSLEQIYIYDVAENAWEEGPEIPMERRRGANGVVAFEGKIYMIGGITNGHVDGYVPWLDSYEPGTGEWQVLPDAPHARDHFAAVNVEGKIVAAGGRLTSQATGHVFDLTVGDIDIYDIGEGSWKSGQNPIPTERAGTMGAAVGRYAVIAGGESEMARAHAEVEAYDSAKGEWESWPSLSTGRHGTGMVLLNKELCVASGCAARGGGEEIDTTEVLEMGDR